MKKKSAREKNTRKIGTVEILWKDIFVANAVKRRKRALLGFFHPSFCSFYVTVFFISIPLVRMQESIMLFFGGIVLVWWFVSDCEQVSLKRLPSSFWIHPWWWWWWWLERCGGLCGIDLILPLHWTQKNEKGWFERVRRETAVFVLLWTLLFSHSLALYGVVLL